MPAAYYDITTDEGATFRLKLKYMDTFGKVYNLIDPVPPFGFEERFTTNDPNNPYQIKAYARMEVRNSHDGQIVGLVGTPGTSIENTLSGNSEYTVSPIKIELGDGGTSQTEPNIIITIEAAKMARVQYGRYLYDIDICFTQDIVGHPNEVIFKILQGRFIVNPSITRQ
jgi:hypothetical protein